MCTSSGSAAKCTSARVLKPKSGARGSRSRLVLLHGVPPVLAGAGVLELAGRDRQTVHREEQIDRVVLAGMAGHLARDRQPVLGVERQHLVVQPVRGLEVGQPEGLAVELEAVAQDVQRAFEVQLLHQRLEEQSL